jgi:hypothetical protein
MNAAIFLEMLALAVRALKHSSVYSITSWALPDTLIADMTEPELPEYAWTTQDISEAVFGKTPEKPYNDKNS